MLPKTMTDALIRRLNANCEKLRTEKCEEDCVGWCRACWRGLEDYERR